MIIIIIIIIITAHLTYRSRLIQTIEKEKGSVSCPNPLILGVIFTILSLISLFV